VGKQSHSICRERHLDDGEKRVERGASVGENRAAGAGVL